MDLLTQIWYRFDGPADEKGRRPFTRFWYQDYPNCNRHQSVTVEGRTLWLRGQCFFADPAQFIREGDIEGLPPHLAR
jgi:hypothetical protein